MKTLVTGGAGFIGSHLVDRLLKDGHQVVVLDDFSTGRQVNLATASENPNIAIHQTDISNFDRITPLFENIEWIFHLAALADIVPSIEAPLNYHRANVDGTVAVLEAARLANVKKFVYAASSSCYGIPDQTPTPENASIKPMYPYALTKHLGELCVMHWNQTYQLPCISLRFFNVYGPRARTTGTYGAVFGVFLAQKLAGKPMTLVGDGEQTRDFVFVSDVVDALVRAAESKIHGEVFNVGSDGTYSINRLASLLGGETVHLPKRPGEPDCTLADIGKIKSVLGWRPTISFESGVEIMLECIDHWKDSPVWDEQAISEATQSWFKHLGNSASDDSHGSS